MERKTLQAWAGELGYKILDPDGFDRKDPELWNRLFTKEEFDAGFTKCTVEHLPDDYSLSPEAAENVARFFRGAEQSLHIKAWRQLMDELKGIADYIAIQHRENVEAKKKEN